MELHVQAPIIPLPTHHSNFSSPKDSFTGPPQLSQQAGAPILPAMELRGMGGQSTGHAFDAWLHRRLHFLWPLCGIEDDTEDTRRHAKAALELIPPGSPSHGPLTTSPLPTKGTGTTRQVNSTQPTHCPAMVIVSTQRERDAERIRGGRIHCCGGFTIAGRQDKTPGIAIDTLEQFEKRTSPPETLAPGDKSRTRTQSQINSSRLAISNRIPSDNERAYYGLAAAAPSFNTIESSVSSNQPPLTNAIGSTNFTTEGVVSGDASGFDAENATVAPFTSNGLRVSAQLTETGLPSV